MVAPIFDAETPKGTSHMNEGEANALAPQLGRVGLVVVARVGVGGAQGRHITRDVGCLTNQLTNAE